MSNAIMLAVMNWQSTWSKPSPAHREQDQPGAASGEPLSHSARVTTPGETSPLRAEPHITHRAGHPGSILDRRTLSDDT
jgi:hypothetical protein